MRIAITILVIIGIVLSIGLGAFWIVDYSSAKAEVEEAIASGDDFGLGDLMKEELEKYEDRKNSGPFIIGGGILSLIALILINKLKKISAAIFLLSAIVPAIIFPGSLLVTFLFIIGGILAFFYKPKVQPQQTIAA